MGDILFNEYTEEQLDTNIGVIDVGYRYTTLRWLRGDMDE